ncbi:MAG: hypothetical protein KH111_06990 [Bacteroidales bacterium]|nr:hypothetical protein [Bacteroidales bacterium]
MNEFNQLWDEVAVMVDFEAKRLRNGSDKVNVQQIETFYKAEIIDKLWFDFIFPNKFNKWVCDYYKDFPAVQREIRERMDSFSLVSRRKQFPVLLVVGIVIFILGLLSFAIPELEEALSICVTLVGVGLGIWGFTRNNYAKKYCDRSTLTEELDRIKNEVNNIIHEHTNC